MKKNVLFLFAIFWFCDGFSQNNNNVTCVYNIYTPFDLQNLKTSTLSEKILKTKPISYILNINNNKSQFFSLKNLQMDDVDAMSLKLRKTMSFSGKYIEISLTDDEIFEMRESMGEKFGINTKISDYKWNITADKKIIDNYTCLKAICQVKGRGRDGVLINKDVIAYFCPELNYQFGPREFCGLPGLILEVIIDNTVIGLESINFYKPTSKNNYEQENRKDLKLFNSYMDLSVHLYGKFN
jgi:GLPGLI family protein